MGLLSAFNPHELPESRVRTVATGRDDELADILKTIRGNLAAATMQHLILSAPRGYGKSFMMRHIELEVSRIAREENLALVPLLMPEEMPHVREPETFIREVTRALTGGAAGEAELTWHEDDGAAWEGAVAALEVAIEEKVGANGLVVALVENFDLLLRRAFAKDVQASRLRLLLSKSGGRLMLIAASASGAFDRSYDDRLFQAFREIELRPWTVEQCLDFFDRQRRDAGKPPLEEMPRARARAVASFIGGTPRLATLLGDALFDADMLRAADLLHRLVDELTPYYKERVEALPGRSQKLLDALLRGGEPATQSEIAKRVQAASQSAIAGPFNDLVRERIVIGEKAPGSAEVLYRVADRVFAHYYRRRIIDHGKTACPLEALVDLLAEFYSRDEKKEKAAEFARRGHIAEARVMARLHETDGGIEKGARAWMLHGLATYYIPKRLLPLAAGPITEILCVIADFMRRRDVEAAYRAIDAALSRMHRAEDRVLLLLARSRLHAFEGIEGGLAAAEDAVAASLSLNDQRFERTSRLAQAWSLSECSRHIEALELCRQLSGRPDASDLDRAIALRLAAHNLGALGRCDESVSTGREAAALADAIGEKDEQSLALRHTAFSLGQLGRHDEAVATAREAAALAGAVDDKGEKAEALSWAAFSLGQLSRHEEVVATAREAAALAGAVDDKIKQAVALSWAAFSLGQLRRHDEAVGTAREAAALAGVVGARRTRAVALRHAAFSLGKLGRHDEAVGAAREAAAIARGGGDKEAESYALDELAMNLARLGAHDSAIDALAAAGAIATARADNELAKLLLKTAVCMGWEFFKDVVATAPLHALLRAASEKLDVEGVRRDCLDEWMRILAEAALYDLVFDPERLATFATAVELHFPGRYSDSLSRLGGAARYLASGRDADALSRLDPDLATTLREMYPPKNKPPANKRKTPPRGKPK